MMPKFAKVLKTDKAGELAVKSNDFSLISPETHMVEGDSCKFSSDHPMYAPPNN